MIKHTYTYFTSPEVTIAERDDGLVEVIRSAERQFQAGGIKKLTEVFVGASLMEAVSQFAASEEWMTADDKKRLYSVCEFASIVKKIWDRMDKCEDIDEDISFSIGGAALHTFWCPATADSIETIINNEFCDIFEIF